MPELQQIPLFADDLPKDQSPLDGTQIVQTILYHSEPENREFKRLCKEGMKLMYPNDYQTRGNVSDFLLDLLKRTYATQDTETTA